jgi:hypothetical protein
MKKLLLIICAVMLYSCTNDDWKSEIEELRVEINYNTELIEKLQNSLTIDFLEELESGYEIHFSDGTSINIEDGSIPVMTIGENGNWFIDGIDTGKKAQGEEGYSPTMTIGENGNWFIDGIDTGKKAQGEDGDSAPYITNIVYNDNYFTFYFSDGTQIQVITNVDLKKIACWGDSLTAGDNYPKYLQELLGNDYEIINCGVGGENSTAIAARQGGLPMYIKNSVELSNTTEPLEIGSLSDVCFYSTYNNTSIKPLIQGGFTTINNCIIDDIECIIRYTGTSWNDYTGKYTLERVTEGNKHTIPAKSIVLTSSMKKYRNLYANVFFIGQNGGFSDSNDLLIQYKKMVEFSSSSNYVIIGLHKKGSVENMKNIEEVMIKEFGARFINLREYLATSALDDANLTPTEADAIAMQNGECPPQLLKDDVHFTSKASSLIGNLVFNRFQNLGVFN